MKKASLLALLSLLPGLATAGAQEKKKTGAPPVEESLKAMKVPDGLEVTFWAG